MSRLPEKFPNKFLLFNNVLDTQRPAAAVFSQTTEKSRDSLHKLRSQRSGVKCYCAYADDAAGAREFLMSGMNESVFLFYFSPVNQLRLGLTCAPLRHRLPGAPTSSDGG